MGQHFQIGGDKTPTHVGKNGVDHGLAYIPPAWLGGQGLSLVIFLNAVSGFRPLTREGVALGLFIFASYLLESTGFLSPEDQVNQPARYFYFQEKGKAALVVVAFALSLGFAVLGTLVIQWKILAALFSAFVLLFCYSVLRWKEYGIFKPIIVSLAWIISILGFLGYRDFPSWELVLSLFLLLILDSLWLDVRDRKGDQAHGIKIKLIKRKPYFILFGFHLLFAIYLLLFPFSFSNWILASSFILLICGAAGRLRVSRWSYGLLIPLWSYFLAISTLVGSLKGMTFISDM